MTNKTIDGVPRELLENLLHCGDTNTSITPYVTARIRELLAAPQTHPLIKCLNDNGELIALKATVAQMISELERRRGKPVGEIAACESCDGTGVDLWKGTTNLDGDLASCSVCKGSGYVEEKEIEQPAPVSLVPTTEEFMNAFVLSKYVDTDQAEDLAEIATRACRDKVKELNQ